ncbi:hypothetical protein [Microvirga sp. M2]|uniref:hypothetical protein n=1 Tax=Microvirga sp. M2 TaxID=3073270 RepID=UPI0039C422CD
MGKPLSEHLADLSVRAKDAEHHIAAAKKEAYDKIMERREQMRAAAETAVKKVDQDLKSANETAAEKVKALKAKIATDMDALKSDIAQHKHERDVARAANQAERLEWEATLAVNYAAASIEQAELAVIDAMIGRAEAERAKAS